MLYFSELRGKTILAGDLYVGVLDDIVFKVSPTAPVTKLFLKKLNGQKFFLPYSAVERIGTRIHVDANFVPVELEENELFVGKNLSDQQIIDINGSNIVRVNDVVFIQQPNLHISGVDVGALGLLRWFGLEDIVRTIARLLKQEITPRFLAWIDIAPVELARGRVMMNQADTKLKRLKPEELAGHLDKMNLRNVKRIINLFDDSYAANVIGKLSISSQVALMRSFVPQRAASILSLIESSEVVDILLALARHDRDKIVNLFERNKQQEIKRLMGLARTPVGHIVSNDYVTSKPNETASMVTHRLKEAANEFSDIRYVYVVNDDNQLIGIFTLFELLIQKGETAIYKFMIHNPVAVQLTTPKELVIRKMVKYKLNSLPVVTEKRHMLGVIKIHDLLTDYNV